MTEFERVVRNFHRAYKKGADRHLEKYQNDHDEGLKTLYKIITIVPSGQGGDEFAKDHRASLWVALNALIGYLKFRPENPEWANAGNKKPGVNNDTHISTNQ